MAYILLIFDNIKFQFLRENSKHQSASSGRLLFLINIKSITFHLISIEHLFTSIKFLNTYEF